MSELYMTLLKASGSSCPKFFYDGFFAAARFVSSPASKREAT
jgi:hypothetical protein